MGTSPGRNRRDGRDLTYLEVGDPNGPLVIHNHGGPSSRLEARLLRDAASKNGLRLVCVDRPGMGQSSPQKARTYAGWAEDLTTIADALGYHEFGVHRLVGRWPVGTRGGRLHRPGSAAPRQQHRARKLRSIRRQLGARESPVEDRRARRIAGAAFQTRLPPHVRGLGLTAKRFPRELRQAGAVTASTTTTDRSCSRPEVATAFGDACAECFAHGSDGLVSRRRTALSEMGFRRQRHRTASAHVAGPR